MFQIVRFGGGLPVTEYTIPEGKTLSDVFGGKGAGLIQMSEAGAPIPLGVVVSIDAFHEATDNMSNYVKPETINAVVGQIAAALPEKEMLLWSVRSGAPVSMPGMMDTILNVGLNDKTISYFEAQLGSAAAWDCYRRLLEMYGNTVLGFNPLIFSAEVVKVLKQFKFGAKKGPKSFTVAELTPKHVERLCKYNYPKLYKDVDRNLPGDWTSQVAACVRAVYESWWSPRAKEYRKLNKISDTLGTAVIVQQMVFGNLNKQSATGVCFTRDPDTGANGMVGEWLPQAQGEDIVSGTHTPRDLSKFDKWNVKLSNELRLLGIAMEEKFKDMQDMEFTVENGKLWLLQTRAGKRSATAAFKIAHDLVVEEIISESDIASRVTARQFEELSKAKIDPAFNEEPTATGLAGGGGIATGKAVFSSKDAVQMGDPCILITQETTPDDIAGMAKAEGILTATGGKTSHAAVVARGMDKACVVGCTSIAFPLTHKGVTINGTEVAEFDKVTIDGATGRVWVGVDVPVVGGGPLPPYVTKVMLWLLKATHSMLAFDLSTGNMAQLNSTLEVAGEAGVTVYIDTALVNNGKLIEEALTLVNSKTVPVMLGLACAGDDGLDIELENVFGVDEGAHYRAVKAAALLDQGVTRKVPIWITGIEKYTYTTVKELRAKGFKLVRKLENATSLLDSGELMVADDATIKTLFGSHEGLVKLAAALGKSIRLAARAVTEFRAALELLKD